MDYDNAKPAHPEELKKAAAEYAARAEVGSRIPRAPVPVDPIGYPTTEAAGLCGDVATLNQARRLTTLERLQHRRKYIYDKMDGLVRELEQLNQAIYTIEQNPAAMDTLEKFLYARELADRTLPG